MKKLFLLLLSAAFVAIMFSVGTPSIVEARSKIPKVNARSARTAVLRGGAYAMTRDAGVSVSSGSRILSGSWRNVPSGSDLRRLNASIDSMRKRMERTSRLLHNIANFKTPSLIPLEQLFPKIPQDELAYRKALKCALDGGYDESPDSLLALVCEAERRNHLIVADTLMKRVMELDSLDLTGLAYNEPKHPMLREKWRQISHRVIENAFYQRLYSGDRVDYTPDSLDRCEPYVCEMILVDRYVPRLRPLVKIAWSPDLVDAVDIFAEAADSIFAHGEDFDPVLQRSVFANLYNLYLLNRRYDEAENLEDRAYGFIEKTDTAETYGLMRDLINVRFYNDERFYDDPTDLSWPIWKIDHSQDPADMTLGYVNILDQTAFDKAEGWELFDRNDFTVRRDLYYDIQCELAKIGLEIVAAKGSALDSVKDAAVNAFLLEESLYLLQARDRRQLAAALAGLQDLGRRIEANTDKRFADLRCINAVHQAYLAGYLSGNIKDVEKTLKKNQKLLKREGVTDPAKEFYNECMAQIYDQLGKPDKAKKHRAFKADQITRDALVFRVNMNEMHVSPDFKK